jgi:hypothetical protein
MAGSRPCVAVDRGRTGVGLKHAGHRLASPSPARRRGDGLHRDVSHGREDTSSRAWHRRTGPARITGGPADGGASCRPTDVERTAIVPSSCCRAVRFRGAEARRPRRGRPPSNPAGSHGRPRIAAPRCAQRRPSFAPTPLWAPRSRASPRRVTQPPEGVGAACRRPYPSACRLTRTAFAYRRQDVIFVFWISVTGPSGE